MLIANEGLIGSELAAQVASRGGEVRLGERSEAAVRWADTVVHSVQTPGSHRLARGDRATDDLIDACVRHRRRLFVVSSSAAYGGGHRAELSEEDACVAYPGHGDGSAASAATLAAERAALLRTQEGLHVVRRH